MGRAIIAFSGSAVALLPHPFAAIAAFWHELTRDALRPYRPELHYMRGPGPKSRGRELAVNGKGMAASLGNSGKSPGA